MRNTGKWSYISVMNNPCTKWLISPILLVNVLSINVADVTVTLEGRVISGKKHCLTSYKKLGSLCMAFMFQNIDVIIPKPVKGFIFASCQIRRIASAHAPGMPGTFSPSPQVSDPDMHHGTCVTHVPWCMPGSLTSGFLWNRRRGKTFPAFPAHAQPAILHIW